MNANIDRLDVDDRCAVCHRDAHRPFRNHGNHGHAYVPPAGVKLWQDVEVGDRVRLRTWGAGDRLEQRTVSSFVEYPANRVAYFAEGGYIVADRRAAAQVAA